MTSIGTICYASCTFIGCHGRCGFNPSSFPSGSLGLVDNGLADALVVNQIPDHEPVVFTGGYGECWVGWVGADRPQLSVEMALEKRRRIVIRDILPIVEDIHLGLVSSNSHLSVDHVDRPHTPFQLALANDVHLLV